MPRHWLVVSMVEPHELVGLGQFARDYGQPRLAHWSPCRCSMVSARKGTSSPSARKRSRPSRSQPSRSSTLAGRCVCTSDTAASSSARRSGGMLTPAPRAPAAASPLPRGCVPRPAWTAACLHGGTSRTGAEECPPCGAAQRPRSRDCRRGRSESPKHRRDDASQHGTDREDEERPVEPVPPPGHYLSSSRWARSDLAMLSRHARILPIHHAANTAQAMKNPAANRTMFHCGSIYFPSSRP